MQLESKSSIFQKSYEHINFSKQRFQHQNKENGRNKLQWKNSWKYKQNKNNRISKTIQGKIKKLWVLSIFLLSQLISNLKKDLNTDIDEIGGMLKTLENYVEIDDKNCCSTSVDNIQINSARASETQSLPNMNIFLASRVRFRIYFE